MATLITLVDGTIPVAADFNTNFSNLNTEVRPVATGGTATSTAFTAGRIVVAGSAGAYVQDANFNWITGPLLLGSPKRLAFTNNAGGTTAAGELIRNANELLWHDSANTRSIGGIISSNVSAVGNVGAGEDDLMTLALAANTLGVNGRILHLVCGGEFAANANVKTLKFFWSGASTTLNTTAAPNNVAWSADVVVIRRASNDQLVRIRAYIGTAIETHVQVGYTATDTVSITTKVTGEGVATNDVVQRYMGAFIHGVP